MQTTMGEQLWVFGKASWRQAILLATAVIQTLIDSFSLTRAIRWLHFLSVGRYAVIVKPLFVDWCVYSRNLQDWDEGM
jgi:hypothetical protein